MEKNIVKYIEAGQRLPLAARIMSVCSYHVFLDNFPAMKRIKREHWDYIFTSAGVFVGIRQLNHLNISEQDKSTILDSIVKSACEIYPDIMDAIDHCSQFVDNNQGVLSKENKYRHNPKYLFPDSLSLWMVWSLLGQAKTKNDDIKRLTRALGSNVVYSFISWWKDNQRS